jgi:prepilin-type processing-associated H-X9-DG protein
MRRHRGGVLINLLAVVAIIGILIALLLPSLCKSSETANRVKCQSNLSQIGKALILYANDNKGAFPQTHYAPGWPISLTDDGFDDANPFTASPTARVNNIPAAMFLLVRTEDLTTEVFTCPSATAEKDLMDGKAATSRGNFTGEGKPGGSVIKHVSYSFVNVYPTEAAIKRGYKLAMTNSGSSDFAVAADLGALRVDDPTWKTINTNSPRSVTIKGNSKNHDQDGQNVLYADGHAEFQQTPLCGVDQDNIFTAADPAAAPKTGISGPGVYPAHTSDSVLLLNGQ